LLRRAGTQKATELASPLLGSRLCSASHRMMLRIAGRAALCPGPESGVSTHNCITDAALALTAE